MIIDVDKVPKGGLTFDRDFDFPSLDLVEENAVFLEPVHAEVTVRSARRSGSRAGSRPF